MIILNENKVALKDMPSEVATQIVMALMEGRTQVWAIIPQKWVDVNQLDIIDTSWAYRIKPKEIQAPWEAFEDWIQWIAMNEGGQWIGFERKPRRYGRVWSVDQVGGSSIFILGVKIEQGDGDWSQQIQQRPRSEK